MRCPILLAALSLVFISAGLPVTPATAQLLPSEPDWTLQGGFQERLNRASLAGDVNGDGYDDFIIGSDAYDNGEFAEGRALVYYGGPSGPGAVPDWQFEPNIEGAGVGNAVSTAGDVNGDGFDDVIVGAGIFDTPLGGDGRVYVFLGSASGLNATPYRIYDASQPSAVWGYSVGTAGDVNGDGLDDIVFGAPFENAGAVGNGRVYVVHGASDEMSLVPDWAAAGPVSAGYFGWAVSTAGDVNGDGYADIVVGAPASPVSQSNSPEVGDPPPGSGSAAAVDLPGWAYVYHGSADGLSAAPDWSISLSQASADFGIDVSLAGDVDGDGYTDVLVGANNHMVGGEFVGAAFLFRGSDTGLESVPSWTGTGTSNFGQALSAAGDVNGDGFADVVIGESGVGIVHVFLGSTSGLGSSADWTDEIHGLGSDVSTAGDINGDGLSDLVIADLLFGQSRGAALLYMTLPQELPDTPNWQYEGTTVGSRLGEALAPAGDVNGDGFGDLIVGQPGHAAGFANEGRALVYLGSPDGPEAVPSWMFTGGQVDARVGEAVAGAGDVNGDGYEDVLVGAPSFDAGIGGGGKAWLFLGSASGVAPVPVWSQEGTQPDAQLGRSVAGAGDVNADGFADVLLGAPGHSNGFSGEGEVALFLGSAVGLSSTPQWSRTGGASHLQLGWSVAGAGDVNGDGFEDVVLGAPATGQLPWGLGQTFVFLGSSQGLPANPDWSAADTEAGSGFGWAVAGAGDIEGDGLSEILVGAPFADGTLADQGRAYLYRGTTTGPSTIEAWSQTLLATGARFGSALARGGDIDRDGFEDVLVGAPGLSVFRPGEGAVLAYSGSATGLTLSEAWAVTGEENDAEMGSALGAGDVNGDGLDDVVVGLPGISLPRFAEVGRVAVHYGGASGRIPYALRLEKTEGTTPVAILGMSDSATELRIRADGRNPQGRVRSKFVVEAKPLRAVFDGTGLETTPFANDGAPVPGVGSVSPLSLSVGGLNPQSPYRVRARVVSGTPYFPSSAWLTLPGNSPGETDVRTGGSSTGVPPGDGADGLLILGSYPNPFTARTRVRYRMDRPGVAEVVILDPSARLVARIKSGWHESGEYVAGWDGRLGTGGRAPSGIYFLVVRTTESRNATKLVVIR